MIDFIKRLFQKINVYKYDKSIIEPTALKEDISERYCRLLLYGGDEEKKKLFNSIAWLYNHGFYEDFSRFGGNEIFLKSSFRSAAEIVTPWSDKPVQFEIKVAWHDSWVDNKTLRYTWSAWMSFASLINHAHSISDLKDSPLCDESLCNALGIRTKEDNIKYDGYTISSSEYNDTPEQAVKAMFVLLNEFLKSGKIEEIVSLYKKRDESVLEFNNKMKEYGFK